MNWVASTGNVPDFENLRTFYGQVRLDRRFWYERAINYASLYATLVSGLLSIFFVGVAARESLGLFQWALLATLVIIILLCEFAKRVLGICFRQFMENTVIMAKLEYYMGFYGTLKYPELERDDGGIILAPTRLFPEDRFLNAERYLQNMQGFNTSEEFIRHELSEKKRVRYFITLVFTAIELLSVFMFIGATFIFLRNEWGGISTATPAVEALHLSMHK